MGDTDDIKSLLQLTIATMNQNMVMQQQLISRLQEENIQLRNQMQNPIVQNQISQSTAAVQKIPLTQNIAKGIEEEVIRKVRRNKKRMIKNRILETVKAKKVSLPELKELIVDVHNYCSKASFYRYAEELIKSSYLTTNQEGELIVQEIMVSKTA